MPNPPHILEGHTIDCGGVSNNETCHKRTNRTVKDVAHTRHTQSLIFTQLIAMSRQRRSSWLGISGAVPHTKHHGGKSTLINR